MSRIYFIHDARGDRRQGEADLPLQVGGKARADVVVPGLADDAVAAYIALADGHPYLQPADDGTPIYHNHERVTASRWLKSGDRVQVGDHGMLLWQVKGDQVFVTAERFAPPAVPPQTLQPPSRPPPVDLPQGASPAQSAPPPPRGRRWLLGGALGALLLAAAFVLLAVPLSVTVEPAPETQSLSGFPPPLPLAGRQLLLPGRYRLQATREGHVPLDVEVAVTRGMAPEQRFALEELPGRLTVAVEPDVPFRLLVDGEDVAPGAEGGYAVTRGEHLLRVETERHLPAEQRFDVAGLGATQAVAFALRPAWAVVQVASEPAGAAVEIDGETLGVTPLEAELMQGTRRLVLTLEGHKAVALDLPVEADTVVQLETVVLPPADGRLALSSDPAGATVTVDGTYRGTTPVELVLPSGRDHRLRLALPGHRPVERTVRVEPEASMPLAIKLPAEFGTVFVSARPADAELLVDGKPAGRATQRLRLSARTHTLEFRKQGYASKTVKVTPKAGSSQRVDVTLETVAQAREAATPASVTTKAGQQLLLIRPGAAFRMGASRREAGRRANESPRTVRLKRPFYLGISEVTNSQYRSFKAGHDSGRAEGEMLSGGELPVVNVTWDDAARYCNWLSRRDGLPEAYIERGGRMVAASPLTTGYRLPTEAEWAYVARVHGRPQPERYPWSGGYPPTAPIGNYADARIADTLADTVPNYDDGYRGPAPVASFVPRPDGFFDLGGNVAEWIHDYYAVYPGEATREVTDPTGLESGDHHVVRGASWRFGSITELRLSFRDYSRAARDDLGFRVARYAE